MRNFLVEGIILKKYTRGEHDQVITIFSPELGKIRASAKGARKLTSHFLGHLEQFNICNFQLYLSPRAYTITQCKSIETFSPIRADLKKTLLALLLCELFDKAALSSERLHDFYSLIKNSLRQLSKCKNTDLIAENFKIKLMALIGIMPGVRNCIHCSRNFSDNISAFINDDFQVICSDCINKEDHPSPIPFNIIKLLNYLQNVELADTDKIKISREQLMSSKSFTDKILGHYLNQKIFSEDIIERVNLPMRAN